MKSCEFTIFVLSNFCWNPHVDLFPNHICSPYVYQMFTICLPWHSLLLLSQWPSKTPRTHPGSSCDDRGRPEFHAEPNRHRWSHGQESQGSPICWFSMAIPPTNNGDNYCYLVGGLGHVFFSIYWLGNNNPNWLYHQPLMKPLAISL